MRTSKRNQRGIALAWTALVLLIMIGVVGLGIDWGKLVWNAHQMQNAAEAAALAGAQIVKSDPSGARDTAYEFALKNSADQLPVILRTTEQPPGPYAAGFDWSDYDIILGRWVTYNRAFVPTLDAPNAVKVVVRRGILQNDGTQNPDAPALALVFGPIFSQRTVSATREAVAWCNDSGGSALICLSDKTADGKPGLELSGTASVDVEGGGIHVNATAVGNNSSDGTWFGGDGAIDAGFINAVGGITPDADDATSWNRVAPLGISINDYTDGISRVEDPVARTMYNRKDPYVSYKSLPSPRQDQLESAYLDPALIGSTTFPRVQDTAVQPAKGETVTLGPGYYPKGMFIQNGATVILQPTAAPGGTIFIFGGQGANKNYGLCATGGTLIGHGVTCYVTKDIDTGLCGVINLDGGRVEMYSPGDWENHEHPPIDLSRVEGLNGIAIWQDPTMVDAGGSHPEVKLNGNASWEVSGTMYFPDPVHAALNGTLDQAGCQIVCGSATILGRADFTIPYDGRNNPGQSHRSFLVK